MLSKRGLVYTILCSMLFLILFPLIPNISKSSSSDVSSLDTRQFENVKYDMGVNHSALIDSNGDLWTWGDNASGQLGIGSFGGSFNFSQKIDHPNISIDQDVRWTDVEVGNDTTYAIDSDGVLWATGSNEFGELGIGTINDVNVFTEVLSEALGWVDINVNSGHSLAIDTIGNVYSWGLNSSGQLGHEDYENRDLPTQITYFSDRDISIQSISTVMNSTFAISDNGQLWSWGDNTSCALGVGDDSISDSNTPIEIVHPYSDFGASWVTTVDSHSNFSGAIDSNGDLFVWGSNESGQLGQGISSDIAYCAPIILENPNFDQDLDIYWESSAGGFDHLMALDSNGDLWATGGNNDGQLGLGDTFDKSLLTEVIVGDDQHNWISLEAGSHGTIAVNSNMEVYAWGRNDSGQLGLGDESAVDYYDIPMLFLKAPYFGSLSFFEENGDSIYLDDFSNGTSQFEIAELRVVDVNDLNFSSEVITDMSNGRKEFLFSNLKSGTYRLQFKYKSSLDEWNDVLIVQDLEINSLSSAISSFSFNRDSENFRLLLLSPGTLEEEIHSMRVVKSDDENIFSETILDMSPGVKEFNLLGDLDFGLYKLQLQYSNNLGVWVDATWVPEVNIDASFVTPTFGGLDYFGGDSIVLSDFSNGILDGKVTSMRIVNSIDPSIMSLEITDLSSGPKAFFIPRLPGGSYSLEVTLEEDPNNWVPVTSVDELVLISALPILGELSYQNGEDFIEFSNFENGTFEFEFSELRLVNEENPSITSNIITDMTPTAKIFEFRELDEGNYTMQFKYEDSPVNSPWNELPLVADISIVFGISVSFIIILIACWIGFVAIAWIVGYLIYRWRNKDAIAKVKEDDKIINLFSVETISASKKSKIGFRSRRRSSSDSLDVDIFDLNEY